jgi:hypothetical protein
MYQATISAIELKRRRVFGNNRRTNNRRTLTTTKQLARTQHPAAAHANSEGDQYEIAQVLSEVQFLNNITANIFEGNVPY